MEKLKCANGHVFNHDRVVKSDHGWIGGYVHSHCPYCGNQHPEPAADGETGVDWDDTPVWKLEQRRARGRR